MTLLRRLATATAVSTLALVAIGGVVRATGSGDACPEWPGCFPGRTLPPLEVHALIEFSHRALVGIVTLLIVATAWVAWRRERRDAAVLWPAVAAVGIVLLQSAVGAGRIFLGPGSFVVTLHFMVAMALVAVVMVTATTVRISPTRDFQGPDPGFRNLLRWALGATAGLLLLGAWVRGESAGLVFPDWPLMDGRFVPSLGTVGAVAAFLHRIVAALVVVLGAALALRSRRLEHRSLRVLACTSFTLLLLQAGLGAAAVLTELQPWARAAHVAVAGLAWATLIALATAVARTTPATAFAPRRRARERVAAYTQVMKPDIIVLLLITTVPAMILAAGGMPPWGLVLATLLGGSLAAGGANAINCYLDRDIDALMARTRGRPLPSQRVEPVAVLTLGITLVAAGFLWLVATVNLLAAALTVGAAAFYVFVYTMWMKRTTPQNIVIGGAAGAVPALVGWAAVTGSVGLPAVVLFAIVFVWTPPHFWALALRYAGDYRAANVPMLPSVRGHREAALQILLYSVLLVAVSLMLYPAAGLGFLYLGTAALLGGLLIVYAVRVWRDAGTRAAMALFHYSITYLALLFAAAAADRLVSG